MAKCAFCRKLIEQGTGMIFVKNDGRQFNFCSSKCRKNLFKLQHVPRYTKWSKAYEKGVQKNKEETKTQ
ncbi:50S ribosomal protein L24e [Candidatus Woesearchaeota archaeon]|nr:50S ribosomal protein L24e [Candidatus Woesearchaeota archaeon]